MNPEPPARARCFVDANILVYHFINNPSFSAPSEAFLRRAAMGDITAYTNPMIVSEALHRIMLSEVQAKFVTPKPLAFIQRRPHLIAQLSLYHAAAQDLPGLRLQILPVDVPTFARVADVAGAHALLTDDACVVALMQREQIPYLITNDDDFDSIPGITVCKPR